MARPEDLIDPGQHQVPDLASGFLGGLPPGCLGDRLAELHLAARQQPPPPVRAALLPGGKGEGGWRHGMRFGNHDGIAGTAGR